MTKKRRLESAFCQIWISLQTPLLSGGRRLISLPCLCCVVCFSVVCDNFLEALKKTGYVGCFDKCGVKDLLCCCVVLVYENLCSQSMNG